MFVRSAHLMAATHRFIVRWALIATAIVSWMAPALEAQAVDGWLRYDALDQKAISSYQHLPAEVVVLNDSAILKSAQQELLLGIQKMTGRTLRPQRLGLEANLTQPGIILGPLTAALATATEAAPPFKTASKAINSLSSSPIRVPSPPVSSINIKISRSRSSRLNSPLISSDVTASFPSRSEPSRCSPA